MTGILTGNHASAVGITTAMRGICGPSRTFARQVLGASAAQGFVGGDLTES
jgi:hypothetical protein